MYIMAAVDLANVIDERRLAVAEHSRCHLHERIIPAEPHILNDEYGKATSS